MTNRDEIKSSFTSASSFPSKLLHLPVVRNDGAIIPTHIQLILSNRCNLKCSFCSCADRDKGTEIPYNDLEKILDILAEKGTKAITITGGGSPLLYPQINEAIDYAEKKGMEVGLVTNGTLFKKLSYHKNITWCRISSSDDRTPNYESIKYGLSVNRDCDFAFSHVITRNPNYETINGLIDFANKNDFTHIRLVSDLLDLDNILPMSIIKKNIKVDDSRVIYQERQDFTKGAKNCYISLLKPVISPEGVFPCCGIMYRNPTQIRALDNNSSMGKLSDLKSILEKGIEFDGSSCSVCYYNMYNAALKMLREKPQHLKFV